MNIMMTGYYDKNFGDDLMQLMIIENMPHHHFFVYHSQKEMLLHFFEHSNVSVNEKRDDIDAYVNVIGTCFAYKTKRAIAEKMMDIYYEKKLSYKKIAVVNCSVEPVKNKISAFLTKRDLKKYNLISCRDNTTHKYISSMCKQKDINLHNDIIFALPEKYIYKKTGEDCMGIVPVQRGYSKDNFKYYERLAAAADYYIEKTNKKVLLFALDTGYENDTLAINTIRALMKNAEMSETVIYNSDPKYILKNFARCGKIVSSRFHGIVVGILFNIPVIGVTDTNKIEILSEQYHFRTINKKNLSTNELCAAIDDETETITISEEDKKDAYKHIIELEKFLDEENNGL